MSYPKVIDSGLAIDFKCPHCDWYTYSYNSGFMGTRENLILAVERQLADATLAISRHLDEL